MDLSLTRNRFHGRRTGPLVVVVMDGVGLGPDYPGNAVRGARTPVLDRLMATCPWLPLAAHGTAVGMPSDADMGNSEVGHNALGAGRVFDQGAKLVQESIASGDIFKEAGWREIMEVVRGPGGGTLHLLGLVSDGNVHSHIDHLTALIAQAHREGVTRVAVHALIDGRDVGETSALDYIEPLEQVLSAYGSGYGIASGGGRMVITMDRYGADWAMVERGWHTHVLGEGPQYPSASAAIRALRLEHPGTIDQDLPAFIIARDGKPRAPVRDGDAVILCNFRGDRAIEISKAFCGLEVPFDRVRQPRIRFAGMMTYDGDTNLPPRILVKPPVIDRTLGQYLVANGVRQFACSETQKFGHVTYFWNGNRSGYIDETMERYVEIPSDNVPFAQRPWMQAAEITDATIAQLRASPTGMSRINYANGDMVGHTGDFTAACLAVSAVDLALGRLLETIQALGGIALVTADHGNADEMYERDKSGSVRMEGGRPKAKTSHTLNPVPAILVDPAASGAYALDGTVPHPGLANVAATCLTLLGFTPPSDYARSLVTLT